MLISRQFLIVNIVLVMLFSACEKTEKTSVISPTKVNSLAPNFFEDDSGNLFISWLETPSKGKAELYFAKWENEQWSAKQKVAEGENWFVNWADFPSISIHPADEKHWMAHWLQYTAEGTYDYEVRITQSFDAGKTWTPTLVPHQDGVAAEHGFVSLLPAEADHFRAVWLDGRFTKSAAAESYGHDHHGHGGGGPMTLRTALIDRSGNISAEKELDDRVCDCCQTGMANATGGPMVVYRDRSTEEIRDISFVRAVGNKWTQPQPLHVDNWKIAGCPVNGPVIRSQQENVAVAWYTAAAAKPQVNLMWSNNGGVTFGEPVQINDDQTVGRVDLQIIDAAIFISWIEITNEDQTELIIKKINSQTKEQEVVHRQAISPERASGFPRIAKLKFDQLLLAWTEVLEEKTLVATSRVKAN